MYNNILYSSLYYFVLLQVSLEGVQARVASEYYSAEEMVNINVMHTHIIVNI